MEPSTLPVCLKCSCSLPNICDKCRQQERTTTTTTRITSPRKNSLLFTYPWSSPTNKMPKDKRSDSHSKMSEEDSHQPKSKTTVRINWLVINIYHSHSVYVLITNLSIILVIILISLQVPQDLNKLLPQTIERRLWIFQTPTTPPSLPLLRMTFMNSNMTNVPSS